MSQKSRTELEIEAGRSALARKHPQGAARVELSIQNSGEPKGPPPKIDPKPDAKSKAKAAIQKAQAEAEAKAKAEAEAQAQAEEARAKADAEAAVAEMGAAPEGEDDPIEALLG